VCVAVNEFHHQADVGENTNNHLPVLNHHMYIIINTCMQNDEIIEELISSTNIY
jgi:hypothetical protein